MVAPIATSSDPGTRVMWVEFGDRTHWVAHGRRLTIGTAKSNDIVVEGKGIAHKHARLSLRGDGRLLIKPLHGASVRVDGARTKGATAIAAEPGCTIAVGLIEMHTGASDTNLALHLLFARDDVVQAARTLAARAPWVLFSVLLHGVLLVLLLMVLERRHDGEGGTHELTLKSDSEDAANVEIDEEPEEVLSAPEPELPEVELQDSSAEAKFKVDEQPTPELSGIGATDDLTSMFEGAMGEDSGGAKRGKDLPKGVSPKFKQTVAKLRRSGLEVVLAFDSTASMGRLLTDAKRDLRTIFLLLEDLVPTARVSLVTYRDQNEEYVTRQTQLGTTHYEALAFLSSVRADGGGDFEEAVHAALSVARRLRWTRTAMKVVVLCGDAPPHRRKRYDCEQHAKWIKGHKGQVHCLFVGNDQAARRAFDRIAKAGGGRMIPREDSHRLALQLLAFAFGEGSEKDLNSMLADQVSKQRLRFGERRTMALPSPKMLTSTLRGPAPDPAIVEAWTWAKPSQLAALTGPLSGQRLSREGVLALYYLVNRALERQASGLTPLRPQVGKNRTQGVPKQLLRQLRRWRRR